eukprot:gene12010-14191_t
MWIMKNTSWEAGQARYGTGFRTAGYFVGKHAVTTKDPRGDQGHFGSPFVTYHALMILEFENCIRAIDPSIEAVPYVDHTDTDAIADAFRPERFGNLVSPPPVGLTGRFHDWELPRMNVSIWESEYEPFMNSTEIDSVKPYNPNTTSGLFLDAENHYNHSVVGRYPDPTGIKPNPRWFDDCLTAETYYDWLICTHWWTYFPKRLHGYAHHLMGGRNVEDTRISAPGLDVSVSPHDPIFMPLHANLERNWHIWKTKHPHLLSKYWGFNVQGYATIPTPFSFGQVYEVIDPYEGVALNDVVTSAWGFSDRQLQIDAHDDEDALWTNADVVCHLDTYSGTAPYRYAERSDETAP